MSQSKARSKRFAGPGYGRTAAARLASAAYTFMTTGDMNNIGRLIGQAALWSLKMPIPENGLLVDVDDKVLASCNDIYFRVRSHKHKSMDKQEAKRLLTTTLADYRRLGLPISRQRSVKSIVLEVIGASEVEYQIEVQFMWDSKPDGDVLVSAGIDDGGLSAFRATPVRASS